MLHCAVVRRTSWGNAHPSKAKSILVLRGPNCLLQGAESLWSSVGFEGKAVSKGSAISHRSGMLGSDVLWYSGMWLSWTPLAIKHPRIFEVLSQEVWEKCSSYATAWIPFLCCFSYVDLINPVFCVVRTFCLSACALYTYIQKHFLEQFAFFSTVIHRSLTTWMRKNYVNLWWWWWHQHQSRFHIIPVMIKIIWHRQQNEVLALSAKHLYPIFCSQILCVMWKNVQ